MKKRNWWYRLFIVLVFFWTVGTTFILLQVLGDISYQNENTEKLLNNERSAIASRIKTLFASNSRGTLHPDEDKKLNVIEHDLSEVEKRHEHALNKYDDKRKETIKIYSFYLLVPIVFIYGTGQTIRWIIKRFFEETRYNNRALG